MQTWYWCPSCERAFQAEPADHARSPLTELLTSLGICEPSPTDCPTEGCGARASSIKTWLSLRKWAAMAGGPTLPAVPVAGERYATPQALDRQRTA